MAVMRFIGISILTLSACLSYPAQAEEKIEEQDGLGLKLEELLSEKGTFRFEAGTTLSAARRDGTAGIYQTIQTGTGEFVTVPIDIGPTNRQSETAITTIGLRYGLTTKSEIYTRASVRFNHARFGYTKSGQTESLSDNAFQSQAVGVNYRFVDEGERPALIGFADIALLENTASKGTRLHSAKSGTIGFTTYRVIDPVVVSLTAGYRPNLKRRVESREINPGDTLFVNPSIAFAVNNEMTLTGGFGLNFSGTDTVDGIKQSAQRTSADLQFGLAYAWDKNTTLRADTRAEVLGANTFTAGVTLTRKFGQRDKPKVTGE